MSFITLVRYPLDEFTNVWEFIKSEYFFFLLEKKNGGCKNNVTLRSAHVASLFSQEWKGEQVALLAYIRNN